MNAVASPARSTHPMVVIAAIALGAILFQVYVPRFISYLSYLELPLLVTLYFSAMRRSPTLGVFLGMVIGLAQDSLSAIPIVPRVPSLPPRTRQALARSLISTPTNR